MKSFLLISLITLITLCSLGTKAQDIFIDMPNLDKSQARLLLDEMLKYREQKKDSVNAAFYIILGQIQSFVDNQNATSQAFTNIPMRIVDFIEKDIFNGSILEWDPTKEHDRFRPQMAKQQIIQANKELTDYQNKLSAKISFRCSYFAIIGLDCPPTPQN